MFTFLADMYYLSNALNFQQSSKVGDTSNIVARVGTVSFHGASNGTRDGPVGLSAESYCRQHEISVIVSINKHFL